MAKNTIALFSFSGELVDGFHARVNDSAIHRLRELQRNKKICCIICRKPQGEDPMPYMLAHGVIRCGEFLFSILCFDCGAPVQELVTTLIKTKRPPTP